MGKINVNMAAQNEKHFVIKIILNYKLITYLDILTLAYNIRILLNFSNTYYLEYMKSK